MTEKTLSLGERLKATRAATAEETARKKMLRKAEESEKARQNLETVQQFFENAKQTFSSRILAGQDAGKVTLRRTPAESVLCTYNWNGGTTIADVHHPYYPVWEDFANWAKENSLVPKLKYDHDGVGMESWWNLEIHPI